MENLNQFIHKFSKTFYSVYFKLLLKVHKTRFIKVCNSHVIKLQKTGDKKTNILVYENIRKMVWGITHPYSIIYNFI